MGQVTRHVPPEPGVTEIRVHGVGGTAPEALLEQTGIHQVTGDDKAGLFRGVRPEPHRTVEAYSWGGLTARSRSRALWILLLPFSLVNLAGWMVEPAREYDTDGGSYTAHTWQRTAGIRWHETAVLVIGMLTTGMYVAWVALLTVNTIAFQCGAIAECRMGRWYLQPFNHDLFIDHAGRRVVLGLAVPLALLALFWILGQVSRNRYDAYQFAEDAAPDGHDAERSGSVVALPGFWEADVWQRALASLHVAAVLSALSAMLGWAVFGFEQDLVVDVVPDVGLPLLGVATVFGLACVALVAVASLRAELLPGDRTPWMERASLVALVSAGALFVLACVATWQLEVTDAALVRSVEGVATPRFDYWGFGWAPILLFGAAAAGVFGFSLIQMWRWFVWRQIYLDQLIVPLMLLCIAAWPFLPWIAVGASTLVGLVVALAVARSRGRWVATGGAPPDLRAELWRAGVSLLVIVSAVVCYVVSTAVSGDEALAWPRLAPVLTFSALLAVLTLVRTSVPVVRWWPGLEPTPLGARLAAVAIPGAILAAGYGMTRSFDRPEWFLGGVALSWVVLAVVWLAQFPFDAWRWNGPSAVAVMGLSLLMGAFAGGILRMVDVLNGDGTAVGLLATPIYQWLAVAFVVCMLAGFGGIAVWYVLVRLGVRGADARRDGEALPEAVRAVDVTVTVIALLMATGTVAYLLALYEDPGIGAIATWIDRGVADDWRGVVTVSSWVVVAMITAGFVAVRRGLRDYAFRARLGVLWDVISFWPRSFHPFAPPAYATRAVPELVNRVTEIAEASGAGTGDGNPDGAAPRGGVTVLSGHSQGSVLSLAITVMLRPHIARRTWLITHGSPLVRFYQTYFPRYFPPSLLEHAARRLGSTDTARDGSWLNFWRRTDPIGGPIFARRRWSEDELACPPEAVRACLATAPHGIADLPDVCLADPVASPASPFAPRPTPRGHSGYMADPMMWRTVERLACHVAASPDATAAHDPARVTGDGAPLPAEQPPGGA